MSIQWTFIAGFLYLEVAVVILLLLPIISPRRWHLFFKSRLCAIVRKHVTMYFYVILGVLLLFLFDAIREMRKYSISHEISHTHLTAEMKGNVKLFRAQRNFYITGFTIFLSFIIRRLVTMIIIQDELTIKAQNIIREAESTVNEARTAILANTLQSEENKTVDSLKTELEDKEMRLLEIERLLEGERTRSKKLEEEVIQWREKYEGLEAKLDGQGDSK